MCLAEDAASALCKKPEWQACCQEADHAGEGAENERGGDGNGDKDIVKPTEQIHVHTEILAHAQWAPFLRVWVHCDLINCDVALPSIGRNTTSIVLMHYNVRDKEAFWVLSVQR